MLLGVFAVKAALFPLYFWLPEAYASASAPVAALFSIMTKVGIYAIVRVTTLIFGSEAGNSDLLSSDWLLPVALLTLFFAAFGALGAEYLRRLVAYLTVASMGTMLTAHALGGEAGLAAGLFYLIHSTLVIAALFLFAEIIARQRGATSDRLHAGPVSLQPVLLGVLFLLGAATVAGLPPFSGFIGKLMILQSAQATTYVGWVWAGILGASFVNLVSCVRAGTMLLWNFSTSVFDPHAIPARRAEWLPIAALLACGVLLVVFAAPIKRYADATAAQLIAASSYRAAVLGATWERAPRPPGRERQP
jgi:multicomponent K+:H+ antiporter subunit D